MFIPVPIGSCRVAILAQLEDVKGVLEKDRALIAQRSYDQLYEGAVHNGLKPSQSDLDKMKEMSSRDVEHVMEGHPAKEVLQRLGLMLEALDHYGPYDDAIIGLEEFALLKKHLPAPGNVATGVTSKE